MSENLSVSLFKPQTSHQETSQLFQQDLSHHAKGAWYRLLRRAQWAWLGLPPLLIEETLAKIAVSDKLRSNDLWLDTVTNYQAGHWTYEWTKVGMMLQKNAQTISNEDSEQQMRAWFQAANAFAIAAYPYLKQDKQALQSQTLAFKAFDQGIAHAPFQIKPLKVKVSGHEVTGYLYLPHTEEPLPTILFSPGLDCLQTECWRLFLDYVRPMNMALLTIDLPGLGKSAGVPLTQEMSQIHQAFLDLLVDVPWVDHHRLGCMGVRLGATAAARTAFVAPHKVKACVTLGGIFHHAFTQPKILSKQPKMLLDVLSTRLGKKQLHGSDLTQLQAFSLKNQGFLTGRRSAVPILALRAAQDPIATEMDQQLLVTYSNGGLAKSIHEKTLHGTYHQMLQSALAWFKQYL